MNPKIAVVVGSSGMIGSILVKELLKDDTFSMVRILVRKLQDISNSKLQQEVVNFNNINDYEQKMGKGDVLFCCIGTTQKKVKGDKVEYRKIDYDIPVNAAKIGIENGFSEYYLVSAIGANADSSNFYLKLKGETENAIKEFPYKNIGFFQPSILLGHREEYRAGEESMKKLMKFFSKLLIGSFRKYRAIDALDVAKSMINKSKKNESGVHYLTYKEMVE